MVPQRVHNCSGWEMWFNLKRFFCTFWSFLGWMCPFAILVRTLFSSQYPKISPNVPKHRKYSKISQKFIFFTLSKFQNKKCNIWATPSKKCNFYFFYTKKCKKKVCSQLTILSILRNMQFWKWVSFESQVQSSLD